MGRTFSHHELAWNSCLFSAEVLMDWDWGLFWVKLMGLTGGSSALLSNADFPWAIVLCKSRNAPSTIALSACASLPTLGNHSPWLHRQSFCDGIYNPSKIVLWDCAPLLCNHLAVVFAVEWLLFVDKHVHLNALQPHLKFLGKKRNNFILLAITYKYNQISSLYTSARLTLHHTCS